MNQINKYYFILILFLGALVSYLIRSAQYQTLFVFFLLFLFFLFVSVNFRALVYYYMLFGALTDPGWGRMWGVTINWLRNTVLLGIYLVYLIFLLNKIKKFKRDKNFKFFLYGIVPFIVYISLTSVWSISPYDSLRYIPKYILSVLLGFVVMLDDKIDIKLSLKLLFYGTFIFMLVSILFEFLNIGRVGEYFEGFSGRHQSKYYTVFITTFLLSGLITKYFKGKTLFGVLGIILSLVILILILQRGAFLAVIFSLIFISVYLTSTRPSVKSIIASLFLTLSFIVILYILFKRPEFREYTFVSQKYGIEDLFSLLAKGDIQSAINIIAFKGRLEMWEESMKVFRNRLFGQGLATTAVEMEEVVGQYLELHNDFLQYLIEGGYIGFILYLYMWFNLFKISWTNRKTSDRTLKFLSLTIGAYTAGLFSWSFFDHVLNYAHMNFAFLLILVGLLIRRNYEIKNA